MFMHLLLPEPIWNFPGMQSKKEDHFPTPKPGHCFGRLWGMMNHWNESSSVAGRSRRFILLSPYSMSIVWIDKHVICHGKTQWTSICQRCIGYSVPTIFPQWNSNHTTWSPSNLSNASENQHATAVVAATQAKGTGIQGTWLILLLFYKVWECQDAGLFFGVIWRWGDTYSKISCQR